MITGTCHCQAVSYAFDATPETATSCNCSICRRLGTLWIYAAQKDISFTGLEHTKAYAHGDKNLAIHSCKTCGCTTHWANLREPTGHMAVNLRLADPEIASKIPVRLFDGADTWTFIDD